MYRKLDHFAIHLNLTQHCKSTIFQSKLKRNEQKLRLVFLWLRSKTLPLISGLNIGSHTSGEKAILLDQRKQKTRLEDIQH